MDWIVLDWIVLDWIGLDWIGVVCIGELVHLTKAVLETSVLSVAKAFQSAIGNYRLVIIPYIILW